MKFLIWLAAYRTTPWSYQVVGLKRKFLKEPKKTTTYFIMSNDKKYFRITGVKVSRV